MREDTTTRVDFRPQKGEDPCYPHWISNDEYRKPDTNMERCTTNAHYYRPYCIQAPVSSPPQLKIHNLQKEPLIGGDCDLWFSFPAPIPGRRESRSDSILHDQWPLLQWPWPGTQSKDASRNAWQWPLASGQDDSVSLHGQLTNGSLCSVPGRYDLQTRLLRQDDMWTRAIRSTYGWLRPYSHPTQW